MNREVMVKALNVIKDSVVNTDFPLTNKLADAIYAIEVELAEPEQVNKIPTLAEMKKLLNGEPIELAKPEQEPNKEWVGLTDEELNLIYAEPQTHVGQYARAIEAKLKEKNTTN